MTRKLSVTESQSSGQFCGTSLRRKVSTSHGIVVEIEDLGDPFAAQAVIQKQDRVRTASNPVLRRTVAGQPHQFLPFLNAQKASPIMPPSEILIHPSWQPLSFGFSMSQGINEKHW